MRQDMEKLKVNEWRVYRNKHDNKWYATKRINNILHTVYIGKDCTKTGEKLREYCEKKGMALERSEDERSIEREKLNFESNPVSELAKKVSELSLKIIEQQREIDLLKALLKESRPTASNQKETALLESAPQGIDLDRKEEKPKDTTESKEQD